MARRALSSFVEVHAALIALPAVHTSLAGIAYASGAPSARFTDVAFTGGAVAIMTQPQVQTSIAGITVAFTEGVPDKFAQRAWGYSMDGHSFYVLHLGQEGTFVFDLTTQEWSQFQTAGYPTWNMEAGAKWNEYIIGGSVVDGSIWYLDPDAFLDENFREITRIVTGGLPQRARKALTNYGVSISAAVGAIDEDSDSSISLEISDDNGVNWIDVGTIVLEPNATKQELNWSGGLGMITAPGRVYRFTDVGSLRRIDDADADIEGEDDESNNPDNS